MRTTRLSNELFLIALAGAGLWGCKATTDDGTGGGAGTPGTCGTGGSGGSLTFDSSKPPCDTYELEGGPCVAAHSTVRRLYSKYTGPLYQVRRDSDNTTKDIPLDGEFAKSSVQDEFCADESASCTISIIYDQSGQENHLTKSPPGQKAPTGSKEADARALPVTLKGHKVYGEHNIATVGYRNNSAKGTASGDEPQTVYMVAGGEFYNGGCCFDYGNAERNSADNGDGTMQAVYFGNCTIWNKGDGDGPWIMGDLENGLWAGDSSPYANNKSLVPNLKYVMGLVKGESRSSCIPDGHWVIKSGNAQSGGLNKPFDGPRPKAGQYNPMRQEGAIILGTGGDNSNAGKGDFFEGVMTKHFSSDAADDAVQANIVSVYGQ